MRIIESNDRLQWEAVLRRCSGYDFYHLPTYNAMEAELSSCQAKLFVYEEDDAVIALPVVIRPLAGIEGLNENLGRYSDSTSVYGYAGPVTNTNWENEGLNQRFADRLRAALKEAGVISAFQRLHPLLNNHRGLALGEVVDIGYTISIDLTLPSDMAFTQYRARYRTDIRNARKRGLRTIHDVNWTYFEFFQNIYKQTMDRVGASSQYYFDAAYFAGLRAALGDSLHLFVVRLDDVILSAALFTLVNGIVQYHLGGTNPEYPEPSANKLLFDDVRLWAKEAGASVLHLGGGLGSRKDSLYQFKSGFSDREHRFKIWRYVVDQTLYSLAESQRRSWFEGRGQTIDPAKSFPSYRVT